MKNLKLKLLTAALASAMVLTPVAGTVSDSAVVEAEASAKKLTKYNGTVNGPSGREVWYNLDMSNIVEYLNRHFRGKKGLSKKAHYFVRKDGVKCYGDKDGTYYIMAAANTDIHPKGTILKTTRGKTIICDKIGTGNNYIDIAVTW